MSARILVVDDDFDNRTIVCEALQAAGFETMTAVNGLEALAMVEANRPDLMLLDLSMPKMNGWEVAMRLRAKPEHSAMPIVAFTANAMRDDQEKALKAGCDDYLSKPCTPRDVIRKIQSWLARSAAKQTQTP